MARKPKVKALGGGSYAGMQRKQAGGLLGPAGINAGASSPKPKPKGGKPKVGKKMLKAMFKKAPALRGTSGKTKQMKGGIKTANRRY